VIQRDYIGRLIEQCAEFLRQALHLRKAGELEPTMNSGVSLRWPFRNGPASACRVRKHLPHGGSVKHQPGHL
jgi:hypothetical protein